MGETAYQKIVDSHLLGTFLGKSVLWLDWVWGHEITTPNAIMDMTERGLDVVFNPNRVKMMIDHINPAKDTASAIQGKLLREWCKAHRIEFLDVGRNGVCHAIIPEKGWILPGQIGIMGDSHTCTHGAFGAFTAGVGTTTLELGIITGLWTCAPQKVIRVNFMGNLPANVFAKDLILTLINEISVKGATNAVLEFGGNVINQMSMEGRMTITNMAAEAGATSGMMPVDEITIKYLWPVLKKKYATHKEALDDLVKWNSDPDAGYYKVVNINVTKMVPVTTDNYSPGDVVPVSQFVGKKVDQVYIGSCTNGRIEDLRVAASIFRQSGKKVADGVRCIVVPATQFIYERALKEGLIKTFVEAGCFVSGPTCGACLGMSCGVLAPGEVCVSTTNRNFPGRMGEGGMVHLVSPATAAITAINGVITEPSLDICGSAIICRDTSMEAQGESVRPTEWQDVDFKKPDYAELFASIGGGAGKDFSGRVFYLPTDNVDTDQIIPAKYLTETDKKKFGKHCLEGALMSAEERLKLYQSEILVAGDNFGCGSSREHAVWALLAAGIKCVIATSFARIFEDSMFANGLLCITLPKETIGFLMKEKPEKISVNLDKGIVEWNANDSAGFNMSDEQKKLIRDGGIIGSMLELAA